MGGRVQGFGGRILSSTTKTAKYLNSPESDVYHKSQVLYGLYESKKAIAKEDVCYLVEGYTDVIQMYQNGIENVVSSSGTALTPEQIRLIRRLTSNIVVLFDGDAAGLRAALRGVDLILEQGMNVKICTFPDGEDPDSFAKAHSEEEIKDYLIDSAKDFIEFKTDILLKDANNDPVKKAATVREIVMSISKIPDPIQQEIYIKQCAASMEVSEPVLFNALAQEQNKTQKPVRKISNIQGQEGSVIQKASQVEQAVNPLFYLERQIINILIQYGNHEATFDELIMSSDEEGNLIEESKTILSKVHEKVFLDLQQDEVELIQPEFQSLYSQLIESYQLEGELKLEKIMQQEDPGLGKIISDILLADEVHQLHDWEKKNIFVKDRQNSVGQLVSETILTFRRYLIDQKIQSLLEEVKEKKSGKLETEFLEDVMQYQSLKKLLSKKLNRVL
jgi:DNA primase